MAEAVGEAEGVGELDGVGLEVGVGVADGEVVADGDVAADGDVVGDGVVDGVVEGEREGVAGAELPWTGPTRFGVCTWWPVNSRATAAIAMPRTATAPPWPQSSTPPAVLSGPRLLLKVHSIA